MNIRFYNALILTMEEDKVFEGELWTSDNKISYVGPKISNPSTTFDEEIDCEGNLLMPGFKNAHAHTAMTFSRSLADTLTLNDWLHKAIFPIEGKLTTEHLYWFNKLGFAEYIKSGVTSCFDMYFQPEITAKAAIDTGFRFVFCGSVNDYGGIDRLEDEFQTYNNYNELISYVLGFHAEYTTSKEIMERISSISHKYKAPVFAHIAETKDEVDGCYSRYGMSPVKVIDSLGLFDYGGGGFHCVWFDEEDMKIFKEKNLYSVFNAASNLKLASGIANVNKFVDAGMNIAIGTDGAGSNNSLNMFKEMFLCSVLCNIKENKACAVHPFEILKAATVGSARCMGLNDSDILAEGKNADIIMINMKDPSMQPVNNITANLVYSGDSSIVKMTMINGKILYRDGEYTTLNLEEIYSKTNSYMKDLVE